MSLSYFKQCRLYHSEELKSYHQKYWLEHKEKSKKYYTAYYLAHREELKAAARRYYWENRESRLVYARLYNETHRDAVAKRKSDWTKRHRKEINARRRTDPRVKVWDKQSKIKRGGYRAEGFVDLEIWKNLVEYFDGRCAYCGEVKPIEQDHVVPLSRGGIHVPENLLPACRNCNASKHNKLIEEWHPEWPLVARGYMSPGGNRHEQKS